MRYCSLMRYCVLAVVFLIIAIITHALAADAVIKTGGLNTGHRFVSSADSVAALDSTDYGQAIPVNDRPNVALSIACTNSSATAVATIVWGTVDDGVFHARARESSSTLTSDTTFKITGGYYPAGKASFTTTGYTHFVALVTTLSAGSAEVRWSIY